MLARLWYVPMPSDSSLQDVCSMCRFVVVCLTGHTFQESKFDTLQGSGLFAAGAFAAAELLDTKDTEHILDTASDEFR